MAKKRIIALLVCAAMTILTVVPAFAGAKEEIAAMKAAQCQRQADYCAYQKMLEEFRAGEIAKGLVDNAQGLAAYEAGQAALRAFQEGELAKGEAQRAALKAFWDSQVASGGGQFAEGLAAYEAYQAAMKAREAEILAERDRIQAERAEMQKEIDKYLANPYGGCYN